LKESLQKKEEERKESTSAGKELAEFCSRTIEECSCYSDCAHCPWAEKAAELKREALGEEEKEEICH
jgi:hypothetical protein